MFWLTKFFTKGKSVKDAIKYFHTLNGRMPGNTEIIKIKNAFMEQNRGANVIQFPKDKITNPFEPRPGDVKKIDEDPYQALLDRQIQETEKITPEKYPGMSFYGAMLDNIKKHKLEKLEFEYDEMFNKLSDKAKRIEADPKVLLEAELGTKLTGEETTTQLLDLFKNRPKKASGGLARVGMAGGGALFKFIEGLFIKASNDIRLGKGLFKGLTEEQRIVQHDNLTKKIMEWQKTGRTVGLEEYFGVDPNTAFIGARTKVKQAETKKLKKDLSKPTKTLEGIKKEGTIDISNPEVADEFTAFIKKSDPEGFKDLEQKIQLFDFDVTGRKKNASGGTARVGYKSGLLAKLFKLKKKPKINRTLTKDELDDLYEEFDEAVPYPMKTVEDKEKFLKAVKDEEAYMFQQYKKGNLDPKPGEPNRKRFLEKKLEEMEMSGDKKLMTIDEIEELSSFDLGTEMDEAIKKSKKTELSEADFDVTKGLDDLENIRGTKASEIMTIKLKYPGISDDLIRNIMVDDNPQRKAEVFATLDEAFKMMEKGKGEDEIIKIFKDTSRTKQASGGIAGQLHLNEGGRVPMIFGGSPGLKGVIASIKAALNKGRKDKIKKLFPTYSVAEKELLKLGKKYLPKDAANLAAQEAAGKAEGVQVIIDRLKHDKKMLKQIKENTAKNDPNLDFLMKELQDMYSPHLQKYTDIDKDILQLETIKKNLIMKDRKLNAEGGRASLSNGGLAKILGV